MSKSSNQYELFPVPDAPAAPAVIGAPDDVPMTGPVAGPVMGSAVAGVPVDLTAPVPTIGVDPGQTWTAAVLRVADAGVYGWTLGPVDRFGTVRRDALNDVDAWESFGLYVERLVTALDVLVAFAISEYGAVRIGVEVPHIPVSMLPGGNRYHRIRLADWVIPRQVSCAVLGAFPAARVVHPDRYGSRPAPEYPPELRGTPPSTWGPNEVPGRERDHERAAYDVAGAASRMSR